MELTMFTVLIIIAISFFPLLSIFVLFVAWRKTGRDSKLNKAVVPQYAPPDKMNVILADVIMNERLTGRVIGASIVELTTKGYLQINEIEQNGTRAKDLEIELIKPVDELSNLQKLVIEIFFGNTYEIGDKTKKSEIADNIITEGAVTSLSIFAAEEATVQGYFVDVPARARLKTLRMSFFSLLSGSIVLFLALVLYISLSERGLSSSSVKMIEYISTIMLVLGLSLIASYFILRLGSSVLPSRTKKGSEVFNYLKGLKQYIQLAEEDRLNFLQSVKGSERLSIANASVGPALSIINNDLEDGKIDRARLHVYEELLPYSILFGLEKSWAKEYESFHDFSVADGGVFNIMYYGEFID